MKSHYLLDEYPLLVLPSLAVSVGLNKAIILQQAHYWLQRSEKTDQRGMRWFYKTHEDWQTELPFWSISTIRRAISELEKEELFLVDNFNKKGYDKTKWYTINYSKLRKSVNSPCVQNEQSVCSDRTDRYGQNEQMDVFKMNRPIPDITTDNTTTTEDNVDKLGNRFLELRGKGLILKANDYQAIGRVLNVVPLAEAIILLEGCFSDRPSTNIHTFSYCEKYIVEQYQALMERQKVVAEEKERGRHDQHSGSIQGASQRTSTTGRSDATDRGNERQRLIGEDGEIPDTECDF
ncbi:hypothetical protein [Bacillus suaedae]|uniref:hypothetical protein n=1 Tax=Halalkalibacter suaedae TaxID=2822140 RepID=UPI001FF0A81B|nr:hypothetical protein [Bacillus suaedae]